MRAWGGAAVFIMLIATAWSCKDDVAGGEGASPSTVVFPPSNVSYAEHVQPLFNQACALSGCHDGNQSDRVRLTSFGSVFFANPPIVIQGAPDQSLLVLRIQGLIGQRMPLNRNALNQNQITGISVWVAEGARNN